MNTISHISAKLKPKPKVEPKVGDEVTIQVKGKITRKSDAHGAAYLVELDQKDFVVSRAYWFDADEIN